MGRRPNKWVKYKDIPTEFVCAHRTEIENACDNETSWWCYCGSLATGLHTSTCRQYAITFNPRWRNSTMLTVIEQRTCEAICLLATTLEREVPKITKALESIATDLSHMKPTEFGDACYQAQRAFNLIFNKEGNNA